MVAELGMKSLRPVNQNAKRPGVHERTDIQASRVPEIVAPIRRSNGDRTGYPLVFNLRAKLRPSEHMQGCQKLRQPAAGYVLLWQIQPALSKTWGSLG
jgi:hypothetical protein